MSFSVRLRVSVSLWWTIAVALSAQSPPTRFELPNGLRVWIAEDHSRPVALVHVTYHVGSIDETAGMTGIAHYTEHMVYRASQHIRNEDIYGYIDRIGGRYTGGTWPEQTRYTELVPSFAVAQALHVTAERMCCALFDSTEFERERGNVISEANGYAGPDPMSVFQDALLQAAFTLHPYRYNSDTWARDNLVLSRDDAYAWYRSHYGPNNAVLVVAGDVNTAQVRALVEREFGTIPRVRESGRVEVVEPPQRVEHRLWMTYADTTLPRRASQLEVLYHAPSAHDADWPALDVLDVVLAPRLRRALAQANLGGKLTTADSASTYPYLYRVTFVADSAVDLARVLAVIDAEVASLATAPSGAGELDDARAHASAKPVPQPVEYNNVYGPPRRSYLSATADTLVDREALPWQISFALLDSLRARAARVSAADVQRVARTWLRATDRTVGFLLPGDSVAAPWSDGRVIVNGQTDVPAQRTMPAERERPDPVPDAALQPLAPVAIHTARRALANDVVVRAAHVGSMRSGDTAHTTVRIDYDAASDTSRARVAERRMRETFGTEAIIRVFRDTAALGAAATGEATRRVLRVVDPAALTTRVGRPLTVSIVSPQDESRIVAAAAAALLDLPKRVVTPNIFHPLRPDTSEERVAFPGEVQVQVVAGLPGAPVGSPDRRALELLDYIVGVPSYGGRLGWALTKAGLTYDEQASSAFGATSGHILFSTTSNTHNTNAVIQALREVIAQVGERGVTDWELREAKAFTLGRTLLYGPRESSGAAAIAYALSQSEVSDVEQLDLPAFSKAYLDVTLEDVNRVAREYYRPERLKVVAVGAIPDSSERSVYPPGTFRAIFEP